MKKTLLLSCILCLVWLISGGCGKHVEIFVSTDGNDSGTGTMEQPLATLHKAVEMAAAHTGRSRTTIFMRQGDYHVAEPIILTPAHSGTQKKPFTIRPYSEEQVTVKGSAVIKGLVWQEYRDGIMCAPIGDNTVGDFDQLFVNGQKQIRARYPNYNPAVRHFNGYSPDAISIERNKHWKNPAGGIVHAMHRHEWGGYQYEITGRGEDGELTIKGGYQNNRQMGMHTDYRMVENIFEELDSPGEWYYNTAERILYYYPAPDTDITTALFEVPQTESLFILRGSEESPVKFVEISGLELQHTLYTFMKTDEPLLRSDWAIYRGGAIVAEGTENCSITDCQVTDIGGNAVFFSNYNRNNRVQGCHITNAGGSGVCFAGSPDAVRSPSFEYKESVSYEDMDKQPGPANNNYPANCSVTDCLIHDIGTVEKQVAGVQISMSSGITVSHCSIYNLPRAGINISEGTWGGHMIEWNDVFNTVLETGDHGSFNSWGRDRFWHPSRAQMDSLNALYPELHKLDAVASTVIRNNRWRCDHGWDIDLDDGSSNYHIYNNVCLNGGLKLREGFDRVVENNVIVNNSFHPHVWFAGSNDVFRHNIVMRPYYPISVKHWDGEIDHNLFPDPVSLQSARDNGTDAHSAWGDPLFINPESGDYRVADNSPALEIGFVNFDMDNFGVTDPALRKIADTPPLPVVAYIGAVATDEQSFNWMGAVVKDMVTEGERSATGMERVTGVLILSAADGSKAAIAGLHANDVILRINRTNIENRNDLEREMANFPDGEKIRVTIFRNQSQQTILITL